MTPTALGLDTANKSQGLDVIPAGTLVELVMKIRAGNVGIEGLCKRSSKGDAEGLDLEFTIRGGDYDGRKLYAFQLLNGTTAGHAKAAEITRALLRAIFEAANAVDPNDNAAPTITRRANATLAGFNGPPSSPPWRSSTGVSARTVPAITATRTLSGRSCASAIRVIASSTNRRRCRSSAPHHRHSRMPPRREVVGRRRSHRPPSLSRVGPSDAQDAQDWPSDSGRNR
jgi:hypothetical protein